jgi:hypothetical protein
MNVAIRGDRALSLTLQLGPRTWLLAVTRGFGAIDGVPVERALLSRLRAECERRLRSERFRRAIDRPQAAATALLAALGRVNSHLHARTAGHDDYVTAAASLTAALIVRGRAYVMHAGGTAAYLAHRGDVIALSGDDTFDDASLPLLARSVGTTATLDLAVSSVTLDEGDVIILVGRRVPGNVDVRGFIAHVESVDAADHLLVARFEREDAGEELAESARRQPAAFYAFAALRIFIAIVFVLAMAYFR